MAAFYTCDVISAGPADDGKIYIKLQDQAHAFSAIYFQALDAQRKEMLATALTAISTGFPVLAYLTGTAQYSQINRLYVVRPQ